jgi:hypothetical protein
MRNLICWCPETQQPVNLQIYTDYVTLALIWSNPVRFECPHCGAKHEMSVGAACLQTTRARTSSSEMHEALTEMHEAYWRTARSPKPLKSPTKSRMEPEAESHSLRTRGRRRGTHLE